MNYLAARPLPVHVTAGLLAGIVAFTVAAGLKPRQEALPLT